VMVANHQSLLDILVLFRLFVHFKWVSKAELFRIPCVGWNMTLNRYIRLQRGDPESIATMMRDAERTLAEGSSLMIFPEGTRSADGHLKPFKHGAFTLALRARVPLLPVVIEGTSDALPKRGFVLHGVHAIRVRILPEVPYERFAGMSVDDLTEMAHELFRRELNEPAGAPGRIAAT
jgi:1-acyl-sn-glycerol-3-phosphate acyltransferase